jgi:hypothetical protein
MMGSKKQLLLSREDLAGRIESYFTMKIDPAKDSFLQHSFMPKLTWNRFDLAIKLYYIRTLGRDQPALARQLYDAHIHAFSLGDMSEPGDPEKTTIDKYHDSFAKLLDSFRRTGFDSAQSLVALAKDGSILNGAHRCACSMLLGQPVSAVDTGLAPSHFDHNHFRRRGMPEPLLDAAALKYIEASPRARIAILWPSAPYRDDEVRQILGPLAYCKNVALTLNGGRNFISQIYAGEHWMGGTGTHWPGLDRKHAGCFGPKRTTRIMVFDQESGRDLIAVKERIRALFDLEKHSIHMTDTHEETLQVARLALNDSSIAFMNQAEPFASTGAAALAARFGTYLRRNGINPETVLIDSGMVMAAYGLRATRDVDYLSQEILPPEDWIDNHDAFYYPYPLRDLLTDPVYHFHFWGLKFSTPWLLSEMKMARNSGQDAKDVILLAPLLRGKTKQTWLKHFRYRSRLMVTRAMRRGYRILKAMGLGEPARRIYLSWRDRRR